MHSLIKERAQSEIRLNRSVHGLCTAVATGSLAAALLTCSHPVAPPLQENDAKRTRALRKAADERKQRDEKQRELDALVQTRCCWP